MVRESSSQKFTEQKTVYLTLLLNCTHFPFAKVYWKNMICPTLLLYVRCEHESLLNEYGLPHTVADGTYVRREHESLLNEHGLPQCVANTKVYWTNTVCPTLLLMVCASRTRKFTKRIRFEPYLQWRQKIKWPPYLGTLIFLSTGTYREKFFDRL